MSILQLIMGLVVSGLVLWAINRFVPMQPAIKSILNIVVVLIVIFYTLRGFGLIGHGPRLLIIG